MSNTDEGAPREDDISFGEISSEDLPLEDDRVSELDDDVGGKLDDDEPQGGDVKDKRIRDLQTELLRVSQDRADLRREMAELRGRTDALMARGQEPEDQGPVENPFSFIKDEKWRSGLLDDPENLAKGFEMMLGGLADILEKRDSAILGEVRKSSPEVRAIQQKAKELSEKPEYKGLSEETVLRIAAERVKEGEAEPRPGQRRPLSIGGGRSARRSTPEDDAREKRIQGYMRRLGYDRLDEGESE